MLEDFSEKNELTEIKVNKKALRQAKQIYQNLGLDIDTAINMFLTQTIAEQSLPLDFKQKRVEGDNPENNELEDLNDDFGWIK